MVLAGCHLGGCVGLLRLASPPLAFTGEGHRADGTGYRLPPLCLPRLPWLSTPKICFMVWISIKLPKKGGGGKETVT